VHLTADDLARRPAQHAFRGGIDEGGDALAVDTVDAIAGRVEHQAVLTLDVLEEALGALPDLGL